MAVGNEDRASSGAPLSDDEVVERRLEDWRRRLIDLSHRNRLIAFRPTRATTLRITAPSVDDLLADPDRTQPWDFYFPPEEPTSDAEETSETAATVDRIVLDSRRAHSGRRVNEIEVTEPNPARIARILDNLAKRSATEFQDKAIRILYVAVGFLDWHDAQRGKDITSPLVLVPAELKRESTRHPYRLHFVADEEIVVNPSLTEKLRRDAGLATPENWIWEDKPIGQELEEIRRTVAGHGWKVRDEGVIGLFSFQKYVMFRDLLDHAEHVVSHPLVRALARKTSFEQPTDPAAVVAEDLDDLQAPGESFSILDADASQRVCIEQAKRGISFVMQGPPGTGKSQTIANVITEGIGQGKRILFVSEKAAALEVVHNRLAASGLDDYCLMLHGERAGRREVVHALDRSLRSSLKANQPLRVDELERLANLRTLLNGTAETIHLPQPLLGNRTLREVHEQLAVLHSAPSIAGVPDFDALTDTAVLDDYQQLADVFQQLSDRWNVSPADFVWREYTGTRFTADDHGRVLALLRVANERIAELERRAREHASALALPVPVTLEGARRLAAVLEHLERAPALEAHWVGSDPAAITLAADQSQQAYDNAAACLQHFEADFPARRLDAFARDIVEVVTAARDALRRVSGWAPAWEQALESLPTATAALAQLPALRTEVETRAAEAARCVGQPAERLTQTRLRELAELAELAFTAERRPEPIWLVRAGLDRAAQLLVEVEADLNRYQELDQTIRQEYTETALEIADVKAMAQRFRDIYTGFVSRLSGRYRADARTIKAARPDGKLPVGIVGDLERIHEAQQIGARLDRVAGRMTAAFGSRASGRDTNVEDLREALDTGRKVLALSDSGADLAALAGAVAMDSSPDPATAQAASRLREATDSLLGAIAALEPFVEYPRQLFADSLEDLDARIGNFAIELPALAALVEDLNTGAAERAAAFETTAARAHAISRAHAAQAHVASHEDRWGAVLGARFAGAGTHWDDARAAANWLAELAAFGDTLTDPVAQGLRSAQREWPAAAALAGDCDRFEQAGRPIAGLFDHGRRDQLTRAVETATFRRLTELTDELTRKIDELHDWTQWRAWRQRARDGGWDPFIDSLVDARISPEQVGPAFARAYWNRRLEGFYDDEPDLAGDLRGGAFGRWVGELRALDTRLVATGADRLIALRERARRHHFATPGSEIELLRREARKKTQHLPVRVLLARIPRLLSELKPCLMMSPLTVSHFLSAGHRFDMVVFDEASQVPPQDAINCIYRGAQLVVAGDSKQLPPTPFFQSAEIDELSPDQEDADTREDMESILDACESILDPRPLRWHYRSRDEHLIAFSNHHIYDDDLVTFPAAESGSPHLGLRFTHVDDGVYDRGKTASNRREARVVAQRVASYLRDGSGRSVGVIAFNSSQATAIAEELDLLKLRHPELEPLFAGDRLDAVFVKHLEAVQGDERDVIVFSVGYGRDADGEFTMNFGPLNKDGGQRRLNVAVTRAREQVEVVASVRAADFRISETSSRGARLLRDYVAYAESRGATLVAPDADEHEWPTALEEQVGLAVEELGYTAVPRVGAGTFRIDIGVRTRDEDPRYLLGIECDGPGYSATPTARDRERLRHEVLRGLGWGEIHRIWSLDWVRNRAAEVDRLKASIDASLQGRRELPQERVRAPAAVPEPEPARERVEREITELDGSASAIRLPWTRVYEQARLGTPSRVVEFHDPVNRSEQTSMLVELVRVEAPVNIDYAIRRLAEAWGIGRVGHRVSAAGREAISQASRRGALIVRGEFLWKPDQVLTYARIPDPSTPDVRRDVEEIPPEEIALAAAHLQEGSLGVSEDQLIVLVARIFGFDRVGGKIRPVIGEQVAALF